MPRTDDVTTSGNGRADTDGSGGLRHADGPPTRSVLVLSVGTFTFGIDGFVLSGLLPQVSKSLHVAVSTAGQLTTLFALVYAVGSPIIGAATGTRDRRTVLRAGMALFVLGVCLQAVGPSFPVVAAGRVLAALGAAGYQANAYSTAGLLSDDAHRARSLAIVAGGSSVAIVAGLPFGVLVGQALGWRAAMWLIVALAVVSGLAVSRLPEVRAPRTSLRERVGVLGDRRVLLLLIASLVTLVPSFLLIAYLPPLLGASGVLVVVAMVALGCGQVLGTTLVARMITSLGAQRTLVAGAALVTLAAGVLIAGRLTPAVALVCLALVGLGTGSVVVPQQSRLFSLLPAQAPVVLGLNGSALYLASAIGAAVGGIDLGIAHAAALAPTAFGIGVVAVAVAAVVRPDAPRIASSSPHPTGE